MFLLRTTPFEKVLITVIKEGQLRLVFLVPYVTVAYCSCPSATPTPPYLISIGFHAVPFGRWSVYYQKIRVGNLRPLIMLLLRT